MNKIFIFLVSCTLLSLASSGSLFGSVRHRMYEQNIQPNHMISLRQMSQQELLRQKFVLDILFNLQDRLQDMDLFMREYGIEQISAIRPEMCLRTMDDEMRYMMDLCNRCIQGNFADIYSLPYTEELRQIIGLYRLFVTARDFESLQQIATLARKCVNSKIFAFAFISAIRDRQDTHMIIIPKIYEIMPDMYYTEADVQEIHQFKPERDVNFVNMDQHRPLTYFDKSYLWMPFVEMRRKIALQKMRAKMGFIPMPVNVNMDKKVVSLQNRMQNMDNVELFLGDLDLRAYVDDMVGQMMRLMAPDVEHKNEQEMRMRNYMQEEHKPKINMRVSDAMSRMNRMNRMNTLGKLYNNDMEYQRENRLNQMTNKKGITYATLGNSYPEKLPTRNINDERLLHLGRRHKDYNMNEDSNMDMNNYNNWQHYMMPQRSGVRAHSVVDSADPRGMEVLDEQPKLRSKEQLGGMKHPYSYYLQQQYNNMRSQMQVRSPQSLDDTDNDMYGMRQRRSAEFTDEDIYQSGRILLHNIRQLMARIKMERLSLGEHDNMIQNIDMSNIHDNLDIMRAIRLNKMGLDTRQSRLMLEHFNEMEKIINMNIERELQMPRSGGKARINIDRVILNILMGRIKGVSILKMLNDLQKDIMPQNIGQYSAHMTFLNRRIHIAVMMHFLTRINHLMNAYEQQYGEQRELNDLLIPSVNINDMKVDKLRTFVDYRDDDLISMMHCKDMKTCLEDGKVLFARQPRLNHKSFQIKLEINSDREQDVIMRIFLAPSLNEEFMLMDTRVLKLKQGQNSIKHKSSDIKWTMKDRTSYSQLYQNVMLAMQNQYQSTMDEITNQHCRFPHHLLLPRGHIDGLPMKLIVVISSIDESNILLKQDHMMCAMGIGDIDMDHRFYDFRLNRYIKNARDMDMLLNMPNIYAQDVLIYHD